MHLAARSDEGPMRADVGNIALRARNAGRQRPAEESRLRRPGNVPAFRPARGQVLSHQGNTLCVCLGNVLRTRRRANFPKGCALEDVLRESS